MCKYGGDGKTGSGWNGPLVDPEVEEGENGEEDAGQEHDDYELRDLTIEPQLQTDVRVVLEVRQSHLKRTLKQLC